MGLTSGTSVKIHILPTVLMAYVLLSGCAAVSPVGNEPRPMTAADTSWRVGKGFNLAEATAFAALSADNPRGR